jgi:hypothetical protein
MSIINRLVHWAKTKNWNRISWILAIETAILMVAASFFLPGGDDLYRYYIPFSQGCLDCGFIPYFARWILWPLAHLPYNFAWPLWTLVSLTGWLGLCRVLKANPALVLLAFPAFGQIWLGQIDLLICAGLALVLLAKNPYIRGAGLALALIKPQFSIIAVFYLLSRERQFLKVLVIPILIAAASLVVFGINWPIAWITNAIHHVPPHVWRLASVDIWPVGLALVWLPFLFVERRQRFEAAIILSAIATPFVGVYSYIIFLVFVRKNWWIVPLSYAWFLAYPLWQEGSMRLAWILPVALLIQMVLKKYLHRPAQSEEIRSAPQGYCAPTE